MQTIIMLLLICSLTTGLVTEAIKKTIPLRDDEYSKNILAGIVAIVVAVAVSAGYLILNNQPLTKEIVVYVIELIVLSWLSATVGFDKVKQTYMQVTGKSDDTSK